jgi:8-oxo-dGTP pyrophosphatase MutT (NUDIX family)
MSGPGDERVEVVDEAGAVVRLVTRAEMRAANLRHRTAFVVVRTSADEVVAHRRADDKDVWPGRWDLAFGGVAGVGEPWREAAARELAEEAGIVVAPAALVELAAGTYDDAEVSELYRAYVVTHDGPFTVPDGEVAELALVPVEALGGWSAGHELCPDTRAVLVPALTGTPSSPPPA